MPTATPPTAQSTLEKRKTKKQRSARDLRRFSLFECTTVVGVGRRGLSGAIDLCVMRLPVLFVLLFSFFLFLSVGQSINQSLGLSVASEFLGLVGPSLSPRDSPGWGIRRTCVVSESPAYGGPGAWIVLCSKRR